MSSEQGRAGGRRDVIVLTHDSHSDHIHIVAGLSMHMFEVSSDLHV